MISIDNINNIFRLNRTISIFFHFRIKITFYTITLCKIKIIVILYVKYIFKNVNKLKLRGSAHEFLAYNDQLQLLCCIYEGVAATRFNISHHCTLFQNSNFGVKIFFVNLIAYLGFMGHFKTLLLLYNF